MENDPISKTPDLKAMVRERYGSIAAADHGKLLCARRILLRAHHPGERRRQGARHGLYRTPTWRRSRMAPTSAWAAAIRKPSPRCAPGRR